MEKNQFDTTLLKFQKRKKPERKRKKNKKNNQSIVPYIFIINLLKSTTTNIKVNIEKKKKIHMCLPKLPNIKLNEYQFTIESIGEGTNIHLYNYTKAPQKQQLTILQCGRM